MLKYSELTEVDKRLISNGCGGQGSWLQPPDLIFKEDCNQHDFHYWRGCTKKDKKKADSSYYRQMRRRIEKVKWYRKPLLHTFALTYYTGVIIGGKKHFHFGDEMRDKEDLNELRRRS